MIHWLVQSLADDPDLARGTPPPGLLSAAESARLAQLRAAKRRRDWLLGRWTAKHLLQSTLDEELGLRLPLNAYTIETDASGAPLPGFAAPWVGDGGGARGPETGAAPAAAASLAQGLSLSISHAGDHAFCALALQECARVGVDIEVIADRAPEFLEQFFTPEEITLVTTAPAALKSTVETLIWSAKEAVLKALHIGLRADTRQVSCPVHLPDNESKGVPMGYLWSRFEVQCDPALWGVAGLDCLDHPPQLTGWWQIMSNYALTMVLIS